MAIHRTIYIDKDYKQPRIQDLQYALFRCNGYSLKLYLYLYLQEPKSTIHFSYSEYSEILGIAKTTVNTCLQRLKEYGIVEEVDEEHLVFHARGNSNESIYCG